MDHRTKVINEFAKKILSSENLNMDDPGNAEVARQIINLRLSLVEVSRKSWPTQAEYERLQSLIEEYAEDGEYEPSRVAHHLIAVLHAIVQNSLPPGPAQSVSEFIRYMAENFALEEEIAVAAQSTKGGSQ